MSEVDFTVSHVLNWCCVGEHNVLYSPLLQEKAEKYGVDSNGRCWEIADRLMKIALPGGDVNAYVDYDRTFLVEDRTFLVDAIAKSRVWLVKLLIKEGVNVNKGYVSDNGDFIEVFSPLQIAMRSNNTEIPNLLVDAGAEINDYIISLARTDEMKQMLVDARERRLRNVKAVRGK